MSNESEQEQKYFETLIHEYRVVSIHDLINAVSTKNYELAVKIKLSREAMRDALNSNYFWSCRFKVMGASLFD